MMVTLYSTVGCHLCEEAELLLVRLRDSHTQLSWQTIDIADSDDLVERYGIRIPVVRMDDSELGWPFNLNELAEFLEQA